ncbi:hypothetical protein [Halorubrum sp. AS12]|uniref:hypothetical protein n=1 Tax=Halorubrum sp. AS12 TaxID=3409687 RepID=UPI003DA7119C
MPSDELDATTGVSCPYCGATDGGTKTVQDLDTGEPVERSIPWYESVELGVSALAE